jgi:hypothetical protein
MGLTCSEQIARLILALFSLVLSLFSVGVVVVGAISVTITAGNAKDLDVNFDDAHQLAWVFLATGILMFIAGVLGCCGAACKSELLMKLYAVLLVMFLALVVTSLILAFRNGSKAKAFIEDALEDSMALYGVNGTNTTAAWDAMQINLECCGSSGSASWEKVANISEPHSCCPAEDEDEDQDGCYKPFKEGCTDVLYTKATEHQTAIVLFCMLVCAADLLALTASCWLSNTFFRQRSYEQI